MADEREERRLAAILAADMVGYSRLMEADERATIARQRAYRQDLIDPSIAEHHGRIVKTTGDGLLVAFASVVEAVECAIAIQRAMAERERDISAERRIRYRVGINLGDIVIDGDDILGEGVNIAARLEQLCDPGGILVSGTAYDQLRGKLGVDLDYTGEQQVKNISQPIRTYRVRLDGARLNLRLNARRINRWLLPAGLVAALLVAAIVLWQRPWTPEIEAASAARMALPLPKKPSIAVLPFDNLSDDASQSYFADGMSEDLITDLSKLSGIFVIARNSSWAYKGKATKVQQIAEELGVRYVLEGSVRRVGDAGPYQRPAHRRDCRQSRLGGSLRWHDKGRLCLAGSRYRPDRRGTGG